MKLSACIFDFDGTLFDTMPMWDTAAVRYLETIGISARPGLREVLSGLSLPDGAAYIKEQYSLPFPEKEILEGVNAMMEKFYFNEAQPKPHVPEVLEKLHSRGIKMCLASVTDTYMLTAALRRTRLDKYFEKIFNCSELGSGKTEPLIYETALAYLGTKKEETAVFEDALYAARTAHAAGFPLVAICDAAEKEQDKLRAIADIYLTDIGDLPL